MLPALTHLQYLVLHALGAREQSGRDLRDRLKQAGSAKSLPAFYQLMSRLEDTGCVEGRYAQREEDGVVITERYYRITAEGAKARSDAYSFYLESGPYPSPLPS